MTTKNVKKKVADEKLQIVHVDASLLKASDYNPRKWDKKAESGLKESIERFGMCDPIIANGADNRFNVVIGGHFRLHVAKILGFNDVPVVYLNIPDVQKEKELNLRLNRNTGEWDMDLLKTFELEMLMDVGFDDGDLSEIWDGALETDEDGFDVEKELKKIETPKTKIGDIYQLGKHILICGDSMDQKVVAQLTNAKEVDMLYFDSPYNISLDYSKGISTSGKYGGRVDDNKSPAEYKEFVKNIISNGLSIAKSDCHVFEWCDQNYVGMVQDIFNELGIKNKRTCLWVKNNFNMTPQVAFNKVYEPCVYGTIGKPFLSPHEKNLNEILNKEIGTGNNAIDEIMDMFDIWVAKRLNAQDYTHPTEKPVTLHEKPLKRCTKIGDTVLDLFGGSGSTLIACEQMKRRCLTVELSPVFCDLIVKRYEVLTNKKAKLINK
ncbi:MAG: methylase N-4/N-6 protein [Candidatus Moranbacteria bacterium GW2011_GWC2_37_8]|nr:MAG: methylase N-4/N-6 protein [Candidatus Moranbacteria bacterium GW2011_GWC2_37_8]KKQ62396.1 MAG: methylase N-4/N-6 protein [Parcubacteria group bacterium GW2011_GWC1_38_22]